MSRSRKKFRKKSKKINPKNVGGLNAKTADKHVLYQKSVQDADITLAFVEEIYKSKKEDKPLKLREDFCGSALFAAKWVSSDNERYATGLDLDEETLEWGIENNIKPLGDDKDRLELLRQDVLTAKREPEFDIVVAFNFSYWVFHERKVLLEYFKRAKDALKDNGVMILDLHGGPDSQFRMEEPAQMDGFDYVWDQDEFCPITHKTRCCIHFRFKDGSELKNAFVYDWRLWTLPELKDILEEAGFSKVDTWWDEDNGNDDYEICKTTHNTEAWVAYLAAWK